MQAFCFAVLKQIRLTADAYAISSIRLLQAVMALDLREQACAAGCSLVVGQSMAYSPRRQRNQRWQLAARALGRDRSASYLNLDRGVAQ
jgi:hypothetical protein